MLVLEERTEARMGSHNSRRWAICCYERGQKVLLKNVMMRSRKYVGLRIKPVYNAFVRG